MSLGTRVCVATISVLILLCLLPETPNALAQTTTITDVSYTKTALYDIDTETTNPQLVLNATVTYADAKPGYYLAVGVFDLDDGNLVDGLGSSSPQPCSSTIKLAGCIVPLINPEGSERMQFSLDHPRGLWTLALVAAVLDEAHNPISNSFSDYSFTINVHTALTLEVNVPIHVPVSVDGVNGSGSVRLLLVAGNHSLSVPEFVQIDNVTRLRFSSWSDGSNDANRSVELNHDITLTANYITQYRLQVITPVTVSGAGWYDQDSSVTLSVQSTSAPIGGLLGVLGGNWMFQGWVEDRHTISNSTTLLVAMNSPRVVIVAWRSDYRSPLTILTLIAALSACVLYTVGRKWATRRRRRRSASQRRKLGPRHAFFMPLRASSVIFSRCSTIWSW
jgi:hypothetical protein